mmetsp:Transcript_38367/g.151616  ORF Transcript_38367/g.151616 Transcript_38367/m.151616 type:complete len:89 (+) Transcript_38367:546-812(+)
MHVSRFFCLSDLLLDTLFGFCFGLCFGVGFCSWQCLLAEVVSVSAGGDFGDGVGFSSPVPHFAYGKNAPKKTGQACRCSKCFWIVELD